MRMSQENLNKLVGLLKNLLNGSKISSVIKISNPQYNSVYLEIFLDEAERNNNEPLGHGDFSDELWIRLGNDKSEKERYKVVNEFMCVWDAWVELYQYLKKKHKLK